jgi:hypothetical protein
MKLVDTSAWVEFLQRKGDLSRLRLGAMVGKMLQLQRSFAPQLCGSAGCLVQASARLTHSRPSLRAAYPASAR